MDPAKMKVVDLRSELGALGLDTKGNKPALVERLKKALESKTGKLLPDTSILDTTTEEDDPGTPRRAAPRTRRRSSSTRTAATPAKVQKIEAPPEVIAESPERPKAESPEPEPVKERTPTPEPESIPEPVSAPEAVPAPEPVSAPEPVPAPKMVPAPEMVPAPQPVPAPEESPRKKSDDDVQIVERSQSPITIDDEEGKKEESKDADASDADKMDVDVKPETQSDEAKKEEEPPREKTIEDEFKEVVEYSKEMQEKLADAAKAEEEAKQATIASFAENEVLMNRFNRKQQRKGNWCKFFNKFDNTRDVVTPPTEEEIAKMSNRVNKEEPAEKKADVVEPEFDEHKCVLSMFDSDLNQTILAPDFASVTPLSEGALAHAWAGARATHGVTGGRVCYEVLINATLATSEENVTNGIRLGWSTSDSSLHLGDSELSFGYEGTGRAVHNGEFKEYGKTLAEKDVVGVYLDLESSPCKISYTVNGEEQGVAHEFERSDLNGKALFPHVLTKNICYRVNLGYDRYNMLTRTKVKRNTLKLPVEKVIEEKKIRDEELRKYKEEIERRENERREKEKKEREERLRKKREEREKAERERKEREEERKRQLEKEKADGEQNDEPAKEGDDVEMTESSQDEPKENGDKPAESQEEEKKDEEKSETTETETTEATVDVKEEAPEAEAEPAQPEEKEKEEPSVPETIISEKVNAVVRHEVWYELDGEEASMLPGYAFIALCNDLVEGPRPPQTIAECEVILMVGMPGSGKTYWAKQHAAANPTKRYNIISTATILDKMKVDCKPLRATYEGRWDAFVTKCSKLVLKLLETVKGRRRNLILDQTNVYPSAQRRKLREFDGYKRIAVVVVPDAPTYEERQKQREEADGKEVPDGAVLDMKANFVLPEKCPWIDEVIFTELNEEEAKPVIEAFHKEAKDAGVSRERAEKRDRSGSRDGPPNKRSRPDRNDRSDRSRERRPRDRDSRWGGSTGSGGGGGGGGRWEAPGRDARGSRWGPPRPDRWARPNNDMNRNGGDFRGNYRGGHGGPMRGPPMGGGPMRNDRGPDSRGPPDGRFGRPDRRGPPSGPPGPGGPGGPHDKRNNPGQGSWQRGGQMNQNRGPPGNHMQQRNPMGGGPQRGNQKEGNQGGAQGNQQPNPQQNNWGNWGWGNWGNWNQNQAAWNQYWNQCNQGQQAGQNQGQSGQQAGNAANAGQGNQQQWPANYTAQQWYQWQQYQQQQQGWPGQYGQGQGQQGQQGTAEQQQMWAQYYQNYGGATAGGQTGNTATDKSK